jgi:hypothetical protein
LQGGTVVVDVADDVPVEVIVDVYVEVIVDDGIVVVNVVVNVPVKVIVDVSVEVISVKVTVVPVTVTPGGGAGDVTPAVAGEVDVFARVAAGVDEIGEELLCVAGSESVLLLHPCKKRTANPAHCSKHTILSVTPMTDLIDCYFTPTLL